MDRGSLAGLSLWGRKEADTTEQLKHTTHGILILILHKGKLRLPALK